MAEGEGGEGGGEAGEADLGISMMLLGSISFMMATFYLVNHRDKLMQRYAWRVISSTISIFSAVLLFQAVDGVLEFYLMENASLWVQFRINTIQLLCWFAILQLLLGVFAGAFWHKPKGLADMRMNMKTFAVLLGHITGFSAINAWGTLQQILHSSGVHSASESFFMSSLRAFAVIPIAFVCMHFLYLVTEELRMKIARIDKVVDKYEIFWMEETEETENDVTALAISFLVVQVFRLVIGGWLPNVEGEEPAQATHTRSQCIMLLTVSLVLAFVKGKIKPVLGLRRSHDVLMLVLAMSCAWCFFFSAGWVVAADEFWEGHLAVTALVLALVCTFASFSFIFLLERVEERYKGRTPETVEKAIHAVIESLGILVGFSWERSFDAAIKNIAEEVTNIVEVPPPITKLLLAVALFSLVGPAWRLYILPGVLALEEEFKVEKEVEVERFYSRLVEGTLAATESMVQGSLAIFGGSDPSLANGEEIKNEREEFEEMERAMKIEALQLQHKSLAEQSMALAHKMAQLGMTDALDMLDEKQRAKEEADRAKELEATLKKMVEVDEEREREIQRLNLHILHLEASSKGWARGMPTAPAEKHTPDHHPDAHVGDGEEKKEEGTGGGEAARLAASLAERDRQVEELRAQLAEAQRFRPNGNSPPGSHSLAAVTRLASGTAYQAPQLPQRAFLVPGPGSPGAVQRMQVTPNVVLSPPLVGSYPGSPASARVVTTVPAITGSRRPSGVGVQIAVPVVASSPLVGSTPRLPAPMAPMEPTTATLQTPLLGRPQAGPQS